MAKICPLTDEIVLYLDCNECEHKENCKDATKEFLELADKYKKIREETDKRDDRHEN